MARYRPSKRVWRWVQRGGELNPKLPELMRGKSGVYACRDAHTREVLYVGESHARRAWKTFLRHTHAIRTFEPLGEWTHGNRGRLEMAWEETPDDLATLIESSWIRELKPRWNVRVEVPDEEDGEGPIPF